MGPPRCIEKEMGHLCLADVGWAPAVIKKRARGTHSRRSAVQVCVVLCYFLKVSLCRSLKRGTVEGFPCRYAE